MKIRESTFCPVCESTNLTRLERTKDYKYKGKDFSVENIKFTVCDDCSFEFISPRQRAHNDTLIKDEQRKLENLLTSKEIKKGREEILEISQEVASKIFGGGINAFSKYERGEIIQSVAMDRLLRVAFAQETAFRFMAELAGIKVKEKIKTVRKISDYEYVEMVSPVAANSYSYKAAVRKETVFKFKNNPDKAAA
ncbi:MAG: hypothetical protein A2W28_09430 [Gammaproteobacteria bacterium RBG_16_51_14]|nr:MAG: hypothetical protein A2W28_09430 [Gammaproteobacteria bacterium RBG_16_51_14]